jgi:hypothetical protein
MGAGDLSERALTCWLWLYAQNGGRPIKFYWTDRNLFTGGPDQLAQACPP